MNQPSSSSHRRQQGITLIVVLILLVVVTILGIGGARIALLGERSTRFDRDHQVAWQAAEAALIDAEYDIAGPNTSANQRMATFAPQNTGLFLPTCGKTVATRGLCEQSTTATPIWAAIDFTITDPNSAPTVGFGEKTGFPFVSGTNGIQPSRLPRYIVEYVPDSRPGQDAAARPPHLPAPILYRITSMGFGPNADVRVMMQSTFAK